MEQKIIWILLSIIGIISSLNSCITEKVYMVRFEFSNATSHDIVIKSYYETDDSVWIKIEDSLRGNSSFQEQTPLPLGKKDVIALRDSVILVFDGIRSSSFKGSTDTPTNLNMVNLSAYKEKSISDEVKLFTYKFTEEDYLNAK